MLKLQQGERIISAYAESCAGPGWANSPVWVIVLNTSGKLRQECVQPEEQTTEMHTLYHISSAAHVSMTKAVRELVKRNRHAY